MPTGKRRIEVFSAGCAVCRDAVEQIRAAACPSCEIEVLDMAELAVVRRAENLGIRALPAVAIDGALADCCAGGGIDLVVLRAAGLGRPPGQPE